MNTLETLKERLKIKPEVQSNIGVKVILARPIEEKTTGVKTTGVKITADKDEGTRAKDILDRIRQRKLTIVTNKLPEPLKEHIPSMAPPLVEEIKRKPKKLKTDLLLVEEEPEKIDNLPEGGPRLEEEANEEEDKEEGRENKEGEQQILVEGGRLIFGPDIGTCRAKAKKNVSVTDIKSKLAQKNIFKR